MPWHPSGGAGGGGSVRADLRERGIGLIAEGYPLEAAQTSAAPASGQIVFVPVGLKAGDVITYLRTIICVVAAGLTLARVGVYDKNGNRLKISNDLSGALGALGNRVMSLQSTLTIAADDVYFLAMIQVGATPAALPRGPNVAGLLPGQVVGAPRQWAAMNGQADLTDPAAFADLGPPAYLACG